MNYYMVAYLLSGQKLFRMNGNEFRTVGELTSYMKELLQESYDEFEKFNYGDLTKYLKDKSLDDFYDNLVFRVNVNLIKKKI